MDERKAEKKDPQSLTLLDERHLDNARSQYLPVLCDKLEFSNWVLMRLLFANTVLATLTAQRANHLPRPG